MDTTSAPPLTCLTCGNPLPEFHKLRKYCDKACKRVAELKQKKAWYDATKGTALKTKSRRDVSQDTPAYGAETKCTLCGHTVKACRCTCTWCGGPKWYVDNFHAWAHHVCARKTVSSTQPAG